MTTARSTAAALRSRLGPLVVDDPDLLARYGTDWTGRFAGTAPAAVRPTTAEEVAATVSACRELGVALVPQGGNTGLVGGGVPVDGEVVLDLTRLTRLDPVDGDAGQVTAGAGVTVAAVQAAARAGGWAYGVDLASRDSATVGGTVATNAGGVRFVRYGDTRAQLLGVEAVLGTGDVVSHLGGLAKDNTGYHLPGLLCGSEGTLGVVTAARLRLVAALPERTTALVALPTTVAAVTAAGRLRRDLPTLELCEFFVADGLDLVCRTTGVAPPFDRPHPVYLLVEVADVVDPTGPLAAAVASLEGVLDEVVATTPLRRAALLHYREAHTVAINTVGPPHKLDVTLPAAELAAFVDRVPDVVAGVAPGARTWRFGHLGDGNVHVNVTGVAVDDERVDDAVLRLVAGLGGSISAEHGIGRAKRAWLHLCRTPAELAAFRSLKAALDPDGILNPSVLLP